MTTSSIRTRVPPIALSLSGLVTMLLSLGPWGSCPTTPCGGPLQAFSFYSGLDLGFGIVTLLSGLVLLVIGLVGLRGDLAPILTTTAAVAAGLGVLAAATSILWMYVIPGDDKDYLWPPLLAVLVGVTGLADLAASVRLHSTRRITVSSNRPT